MIGSEGALAEILAGELPAYQIPWVNRDRLDGGLSYHTLVDLPYTDAAGAIAGLIHIIQDVTEIGELEQRLMQQRNTLRLMERTLREQNVHMAAANAELQRLDRAKSAFVSIAAHELRTPLASIAGYVEMLLDGDAGALNEQQADYLNIVESGAQRLLRLTRDLLDVARLESGRLELVLLPSDLAGLIWDVIVELRPQLEARDQRVDFSVAPDLPLALVDPARAAQVLGNLVGNASKYGPPASTICVSLEREPQDRGLLRVTVTDKGPGIALEDQERLFRPFERAANGSARGQAGVGLGLYISRSLVELHGGRIRVESEPGRGASFCVTFPIAGDDFSDLVKPG